jgi:hypothetical protein
VPAPSGLRQSSAPSAERWQSRTPCQQQGCSLRRHPVPRQPLATGVPPPPTSQTQPPSFEIETA